MHAQERESYIRSAVDASPHQIAVIFVKDHYANGRGHIAFEDANNNLVFAQMAPGAQFSGALPKDTFGSPELSGATLKALSSNYQTVEAFPLDLSRYVPGTVAVEQKANYAETIGPNFIIALKTR
jgi:hypothetical protein